MEANGQIIFTRQPDGTITYSHTGGRRIEMSVVCYEELTGKKLQGSELSFKPSEPFKAGPLRLLPIAFSFKSSDGSYYSTIIVMVDGPVARFVAWRTRTVWKTIHWLEGVRVRRYVRRHGKQPEGLYDFPKWSAIGFLSKLV